jgi:uncharacterized membrane protein
MSVLRRHFLTGLLAITPLVVTLWVIWQFYLLVDGTVRPWLERIPRLSESYPDFVLTLLGLVAFLALITLIGMFTRNLIGVAFFGLVEKSLNRIPIIKGVFAATKQIAEVFLQDRRTAFKQVVLFEYPRRGLYSLGFVTQDSPAQPFVNVFLPTTPNPTSGFLLVVPREETVMLPLTIEEGIRLIISGGSVMTAAQGEMLQGRMAGLSAPAAAIGEGTSGDAAPGGTEGERS